MKAAGIAVLFLLVAACGSTQSAATPSPTITPTVTPTAAPSPNGPLLFAVLEAKGTASATTYNTVAIAGLDGVARAKTTFTPMPVPNLGCIGAILPPSAHVAAGKVFYADGKGLIRSLAIDGTITTVTTFPMTSSQQELSFAVSPDGSRVLGTILTTPVDAAPCSGSASTGSFAFDAYSAASGEASKLVYHESLTKPDSIMALTGWDALGPIGTSPTVWATQGGGPGSTLGTFVRIDPSTLRVTSQFGDPGSCRAWDSVQSGAFVCTRDSVPTSSDPYGPVNQPVSIRSASGAEAWHFTVTSVNGAHSPFLAPDEQHVVICCDFSTSSAWLIDRQGHQVFLRAGFFDSGWLDATTLFGYSDQSPTSPTGTLAYVALDAPGNYVSMGFSGSIVGTVRA